MTAITAHNADHERRMHERFLLGRIATANHEASLSDLHAVLDRGGNLCYMAEQVMDTLAAGPEPDAETMAAVDSGTEGDQP